MGFALTIWMTAARNAALIAVICMVIGVALAALSYPLSLHSVRFDGTVIGPAIEVPVGNFPQGLSKQVGYAWAPNWALGGVFLLPLAVYFVLGSMARVEDLLRDLVESGMLRRRKGGAADPDEVIAAWRSVAGAFAWVALVAGVASGLYVAAFDLWPVVLRWLFLDEAALVADLVARDINFGDPVHEFDWSVAATFDRQAAGWAANAAFSTAAYLYIAVFSVSILFGGFIFMTSMCAFFGSFAGRDADLALVPDIESGDDRLGFERLEPLFHDFVLAALFTSALALAMHLQNAFLRSDDVTILDMTFGRLIELARDVDNIRLGDLGDYFTGLDQVVPIAADGATLQTYAAALVLAMIGFIVSTSLWVWLRRAAREGRTLLENEGGLEDEARRRLDGMQIWPVGWISLTMLAAAGLVIFMCMWFVNLITLVLAFFLIRALGLLSGAIWSSILGSVSRSRRH